MVHTTWFMGESTDCLLNLLREISGFVVTAKSGVSINFDEIIIISTFATYYFTYMACLPATFFNMVNYNLFFWQCFYLGFDMFYKRKWNITSLIRCLFVFSCFKTKNYVEIRHSDDSSRENLRCVLSTNVLKTNLQRGIQIMRHCRKVRQNFYPLIYL